jgi:hypothetical protein
MLEDNASFVIVAGEPHKSKFSGLYAHLIQLAESDNAYQTRDRSI